jgi:hypothetical protein
MSVLGHGGVAEEWWGQILQGDLARGRVEMSVMQPYVEGDGLHLLLHASKHVERESKKEHDGRRRSLSRCFLGFFGGGQVSWSLGVRQVAHPLGDWLGI